MGKFLHSYAVLGEILIDTIYNLAIKMFQFNDKVSSNIINVLSLSSKLVIIKC